MAALFDLRPARLREAATPARKSYPSQGEGAPPRDLARGGLFISPISWLHESGNYELELVVVEKQAAEWVIKSSTHLAQNTPRGEPGSDNEMNYVCDFRVPVTLSVQDCDRDGRPEAMVRTQVCDLWGHMGIIRTTTFRVINLDPEPKVAVSVELTKELVQDDGRTVRTSLQSGKIQFKDMNSDDHPDLVVTTELEGKRMTYTIAYRPGEDLYLP